MRTVDEVKKWSVTYTKHLTQKHKVYHDGYLILNPSLLKVKLYDDCDKLLDSKIVKLDGSVKSGGTLTFGSYLVDIGDLHGERKPAPNVVLQREKMMAGLHGTPKVTSRGNLHNPIASPIDLSPSHKAIKDFQTRQNKKYSSSPRIQDTVKAEITEWEVLYTTHLTQKAKKFHDGILKVVVSGLKGRQAVLYDEARSHLTSKFLKKEEIIRAGGSLRFDGYIVDIVDVKDREPLKEINVDRSNCSTQYPVQSKNHNEHPADFKKSESSKCSLTSSRPDTATTNIKEWDVMYTTQLTQKAKQFHDGVLKLASSGSHGRQDATLIAEDGTILSRRGLKLSEDVKDGGSFNMINYLVKVGEPRKLSEGEYLRKTSALDSETPEIRSKSCKRVKFTVPLSDGKPSKNISSLQNTDSEFRNFSADNVMSSMSRNGKPVRDGEPPKTAYSLQDTDSKVRNSATYKVMSSYSNNKPIHDGEPRKTAYSLQDNDSKVRNSVADKFMSSYSNNKPIRDGEPPKTAYSLQDTDSKVRNPATDKVMSSYSNNKPTHDGEPPKTAYLLQDPNLKVRNSATDKVIPSNSNNRPIRDAQSILSFLKKPTPEKSVSIEKEHESGSQYQAEKQQDPCSKISEEPVCNKETRSVDFGIRPIVPFFRATSSFNFNEPDKENKDQSNTEISGANMTVDSSMHDASNDTRKGFEHINSTNDLPSFDLGFD